MKWGWREAPPSRRVSSGRWLRTVVIGSQRSPNQGFPLLRGWFWSSLARCLACWVLIVPTFVLCLWCNALCHHYKKELNNFWLLFMSVEHDTSVCRGCRGFAALNNPSLVLFFGNCLLGEVGLCRSLGQLCDVLLRFLTNSLMYSSHMTWSPYVACNA